MRTSRSPKNIFSYSLAGLFSLALHAAVIFLLLVGWTTKKPEHKPQRPKFVQATLVQMTTQASTQDKQAAKKKAELAAQKKAEAQRKEKARKEKAAERKKAEQKKAERQKIERKKAEQKKIRDEKARRDKELKKKQAEDKARKAAEQKKKAEQEKKAKAEREKKAEEARRKEEMQRQARAEALASALDSEDEFLADQQSEQISQSYQSYIQQRIIANWNRPPSARRGMETILSIQLVPTGLVVGVSIDKSSGNAAFDLSAEQAVRKVGRFEKLQELSRESPVIFDQQFRQFRLIFRPDDLRL